jgi:hypothetical protein
MPTLLDVKEGLKRRLNVKQLNVGVRSCRATDHQNAAFVQSPAMLCGQHLCGHCKLRFGWALLVIPTVQCTDLPGTFGGILSELLEEIPLSLTKNTWFQHDWAAAHLARRVREHFTATWKDGWLGLPGHRTSHHWTSSYAATWKPWSIHGQSILKRLLLPVSFRQ